MSEDKGWIPDDALESMIMERSVHTKEDNKALSRRLIDENSPVVAHSMIWLAVHSPSERVRLDAGRYLLDRNLGRVGEEQGDQKDSPITELLESVLADIDKM